MGNLYGMNLARYTKFPEVKTKGIYALPKPLCILTSEKVGFVLLLFFRLLQPYILISFNYTNIHAILPITPPPPHTHTHPHTHTPTHTHPPTHTHTHTHTHPPTHPPPHPPHTPRIFLEQKVIYHGYFQKMNAFSAGKRHVL